MVQPLSFTTARKKAVKLSSSVRVRRYIRKSASLLHLLLAFLYVNISIDCERKQNEDEVILSERNSHK